MPTLVIFDFRNEAISATLATVEKDMTTPAKIFQSPTVLHPSPRSCKTSSPP